MASRRVVEQTDSSASACSWEEVPKKEQKTIGPSTAGLSQSDNAPPVREDWLGGTDLFSSMSRDYREEKKERYQERKRLARRSDLYKPGQHERELNPYWRDGGTGLPQNEVDSSGLKDGAEASIARNLPTVENRQGHLQFLRRSLKRLREEASAKGLPVEEIAKERWGSLSKLENLIREAEASVGVRRDTGRSRDIDCRFDADDRREHRAKEREREDRRRRMRRPTSDGEDEPRVSS
ncbi:CWF19 protein 2-like, partial [Tropilaelaps mercedesae]